MLVSSPCTELQTVRTVQLATSAPLWIELHSFAHPESTRMTSSRQHASHAQPDSTPCSTQRSAMIAQQVTTAHLQTSYPRDAWWEPRAALARPPVTLVMLATFAT